jgi:pSer/pThr/pTyr-binding forkhead associated (FHA) protein
MALCTNCGRQIPCGCPNPSRAEVKLSTLFGLVCGRCDAYNDSDRAICMACGVSLADEIAPAPPPTPMVVASPGTQPRAVADEAIPISAVARPKAPPPSAPAAAAPLPLVASAPAPLALTEVVKKPTIACPRCSLPNPAEFKFCTHCGMALKPQEVPRKRAIAQPVAVGQAAARVLRGDKLGQTMTIGLQATAGRSPGPLSFTSDPFLSPIHCSFHFKTGHFLVKDEGSSSGTFVRITEDEPLSPTDCFSIGDHLLRFVGLIQPESRSPDGTRILGCPRPPGLALKIEELHEGMIPGRASVRLGPTVTLGRDDGNDLSFSGDPYVSGSHCSVTLGQGGRATLRDLGSTNGTFRRLAKASERELVRGDCIRIGSEVLQIVEMPGPRLSR